MEDIGGTGNERPEWEGGRGEGGKEKLLVAYKRRPTTKVETGLVFGVGLGLVLKKK